MVLPMSCVRGGLDVLVAEMCGASQEGCFAPFKALKGLVCFFGGAFLLVES